MSFTYDDGDTGNYYLPCGCWSGQSDHTCRVGNWERPAGCSCGAPDDCYCHEMCGDDESRSCRHCYADCERGTVPHVWESNSRDDGEHCSVCYSDRPVSWSGGYNTDYAGAFPNE